MKKARNIFLCSVLFFGLFGLAKSSHATTPTVSGVAGTVATGQTLTVSGANMVDEDTTNWSSFFSSHNNASGFEGSSFTADGYTAPSGGICNPGPTGRCYPATYDSSVKLMGNQSVKFHLESVDNTNTNVVSYFTMGNNIPTPGDVWVRFYARWGSTTGILANGHLKLLDTYGSTQQYVQPYPALAGLFIKDNGGTHWANPQPPGFIQDSAGLIYEMNLFQLNKWYLVEVEFKSTAPYAFDVYIDGVRVINTIPTQSETVGGFMCGMINGSMSQTNAELDNYWDDFAISSTRVHAASTIEISNSSTYGQGTAKYQEPLYLSDGSVQIKADLSGLGSGPYYLWVTNNRQERSGAYNLAGSSIDTTPPAAPSGLSVS